MEEQREGKESKDRLKCLEANREQHIWRTMHQRTGGPQNRLTAECEGAVV